jgi:NADH:ubiquinone oxidoreductase subunit 3 (subunit A)
MPVDTPFLLPIIFGISLAIASAIYLVSGRISARGGSPNTGKTAPYACGEDLPAEEVKVDLERFLVFAVYFLVFDVLAFVIATSFFSVGLVPIAYSLVVLMAVGMLVLSRRHR